MANHFLKGEYRLGTVFWGGAVLPFVAYNLLSILIFAQVFKLSNYDHFELGYKIFVALPFLYFPFVLMAVWNSSKYYSGSKLYVVLAKSAMCLLGAILIYYASFYIKSQYTDKYTASDLMMLSDGLNKSLPQEIEPNVLVLNTSFKNNHFMFQYKITNKLRSELDVKTFVIGFMSALKKQVCEDKFTKGVLENEFLLDYQYLDKNNIGIYTFNFKKEDCKNLF